jgi:hypothetical protein
VAHDVFVSYSSRDKATADAVCATLESRGIRCWIAPRDVMGGTDWGEAIVKAIRGCRVMVLVFSSHANQSPQVRREVQRAFERGLTVIPLRVEDVAPVESLEYYIGPVHWLDALTPPLETHLRLLASQIQRLLQASDRDAARDPHGRSSAHGKPSPVELPKPFRSLLPLPRSYAATAIMFGTIMGTVLAIPLCGLLVSSQGSFREILLIGLGPSMLIGLAFGLTNASLFKGETATVDVEDVKGFVSRLNVAMSQLGYNPASQTEEFFVYKPSLKAGLAAGRIAVQLYEGQAVIVGPKIHVKKLLERLQAA